jgi:hypothetical protein
MSWLVKGIVSRNQKWIVTTVVVARSRLEPAIFAKDHEMHVEACVLAIVIEPKGPVLRLVISPSLTTNDMHIIYDFVLHLLVQFTYIGRSPWFTPTSEPLLLQGLFSL